MGQLAEQHEHHFRFAEYEDVFHNVDATKILPWYLEDKGFHRVFVVSSRSVNTKTDIVRKVEACLGEKFVGLTDRVGEHAPLLDVIAAAEAARDAQADLILGIGGGSVMDLCKVAQLCLTEDCYDKQELLGLQSRVKPDFSDIIPGAKTVPTIRQIYIPTTMATAEWTSGSTPVDEDTNLKARYRVVGGAPKAIIYDPDIVALTPEKLLMSTAIRGLDHAINTRCSARAHPIASVLAEQAIKLYVENLPRLKEDRQDREAMHLCQLATSYCGIGQMSAIHGFSHWMVHIVGPYASVGHSDVACILMLAQAKWLEGHAEEQHTAIKKLLGRLNEPFHEILAELLHKLDMPTTFADLGITDKQLDEMAPLALDHPLLTKFNLRPLETAKDVRQVLALAEAS